MIINLYVKTHKVTGLKYFGKTIRDPFKYNGSGVYWTNHLKKYGYNISTEIVGQFTNQKEATEFALNFSRMNNIVESLEWANLIEENGLGGGNLKGRTSPIKGKPKPKNFGLKVSQRFKGIPKTDTHKLHLSESRKGKTFPVRKIKRIKDHLGNIFDNPRKLCIHYGISKDFFNNLDLPIYFKRVYVKLGIPYTLENKQKTKSQLGFSFLDS